MKATGKVSAPGPEGLSRTSRFRGAAWSVLLASGLALVLLLSSVEALQYPCPFYELTGYSCLTCGMTRSIEAMGHGDVLVAFQHHLFGPVLLAGIALWSMGLLLGSLSGRRLRLGALKGWVWTGVLAIGLLWVVYGIARMALEVCA